VQVQNSLIGVIVFAQADSKVASVRRPGSLLGCREDGPGLTSRDAIPQPGLANVDASIRSSHRAARLV